MKSIITRTIATAAVLLVAATTLLAQKPVVVGAARPEIYAPLLKGKTVAILSNQSGTVGDRHSIDVMLEHGVKVDRIYSPEHGFRGNADAGEHVGSSVDEKTGIRICSLYGSKEPVDLTGVDVVIVDIQDVGLRFYTYYVTMVKLMNKAIEFDKEFMIFDRPNPNGMYVDGPILDMKYKSGVGGLPIPVVHGLTLGEMAKMAESEGWLKDGKKLKKLTVIPCLNYTHQTRYELPVAPSPNLPNMKSIYLYPSICYFEATPVSLGRGTDKPFQCYGHPNMLGYEYSFTPRSVPGAKFPPQLDKLCHGVDLSNLSDEEIIAKGINLEYVIDAYNNLNLGDHFFRSFFELLIGRGDIRSMIKKGMTAEQIKATWAKDVEDFKVLRRKYLLYPEN